MPALGGGHGIAKAWKTKSVLTHALHKSNPGKASLRRYLGTGLPDEKDSSLMAENEDNFEAHIFNLTSTHCLRILWAQVASAPVQAWKLDCQY